MIEMDIDTLLNEAVTKYIFYGFCLCIFLSIIICCIVAIYKEIRDERKEEGDYKKDEMGGVLPGRRPPRMRADSTTSTLNSVNFNKRVKVE